jgi:fatty-acyl-CoA synthase
MRGYWKQTQASAEVIRDGWIHTGDIAWRDEQGRLFIVDRKKDMIVTGGFNVYPRDVELALLSAAGVAGAAVIGVPDTRWGEAVKAFIVLAPGASPEPGRLALWVRDRKGAAHVPKSFEFVDRLPVTPLGKVDKAALRAGYWSGQARQVS